MRLGALRSLDIDDYDGENKSLLLGHRPDMGTPLKNGEEGERLVALTAETCRVIDDCMDHNRHDVTDDYGRETMLTTENGRRQASSIVCASTMVAALSVVTERMNVGMDVLDKHYDKRSEQMKLEQRRAYLEDA